MLSPRDDLQGWWTADEMLRLEISNEGQGTLEWLQVSSEVSVGIGVVIL